MQWGERKGIVLNTYHVGYYTSHIHLIITKPLGGIAFPVAGKATDRGLEREILQPKRSSRWRLEAE